MIASLPMYDSPQLRTANDAFWMALANALPFDAPLNLTRDRDLWEMWESLDLLFSQTCGLPYRARLSQRVHLVATPDYGLPGCPPGYYHSTLVTQAGKTPKAGLALAYNDALSQSGWGAAQGYGFVPTVETGAHMASLDAVATGKAEVAVIDSHTLRLLGLPPGLITHGTTAPTPGLPFITARQDWVAPLREALHALPPATYSALGIKSFVEIDAPTYLAVPIPPAP
ncbi:MAG: hypothetical protein AAF576_06475 [Pseudomonadota bacterium]